MKNAPPLSAIRYLLVSRVKSRSIRRQRRIRGSRSPGFEQPGEIFHEAGREGTKSFSRESEREKKYLPLLSLTRSLLASGMISRDVVLRISDNGPLLLFFVHTASITPPILSLSLSLSLSVFPHFLFSIIVLEFRLFPPFVPLEIGRHLADGDFRAAANDSRRFPVESPRFSSRNGSLFFPFVVQKNDSNQAHTGIVVILSFAPHRGAIRARGENWLTL